MFAPVYAEPAGNFRPPRRSLTLDLLLLLRRGSFGGQQIPRKPFQAIQARHHEHVARLDSLEYPGKLDPSVGFWRRF
jgi:hypothetical protein